MDVFTVDLATLPDGPGEVILDARPEQLGLEPDVWGPEVRGRLRIEKSGDQVTIRGRMEAVAHLECVRCLKALEVKVLAPFEVFAKRASTRRHELDEELERDDYMMFHDGRRLDLREQARETLLLELPMTPRCRPDCRGLCPRCGADLNLGPCRCGDPVTRESASP
jgi:uncharacterized protein